jgi:hypothetical protein
MPGRWPAFPFELIRGLPLEFSDEDAQPSGAFMKFIIPFCAFALVSQLSAAEVPKIFAGFFEPNVPVKAQVGTVMPPEEIEKYVRKVELAARKDPKWFREFAMQSKSGAPLPFDEKLGLTKLEYDEYILLWAKREFKQIEEVTLLLRPVSGDVWSINSTGQASILSTIRYQPKADVFQSPNGEMKRIADIKTEANSILGEWSGMEWKFEEESGLGKIKENLAVGFFADGKYGLIVYRAQELSSEGKKLLDKSLIIRFPLGKGAKPVITKAAETTPAKPTPVKVKPKIIPQP